MSMTPILHPSGAIAFGRLLTMRAPGIILPARQIRLFHGRHTGPNRGFGAAHIWAEHEREMVAAGFPEFGNVAGYVAVSYTHLDVYKRQHCRGTSGTTAASSERRICPL